MVSGILENVAINPPALESMVHGYFNQQHGRTVVPIRLLNDTKTKCEGISTQTLDRNIHPENYVYSAIKSLNYPPVSSKKCTKWINNDVIY